MGALIVASDVVREYHESATSSVRACAGISLEVDDGELVAIVGPSGSGKSTFLHLLGSVDDVDSGTITVCGEDITAMSQREKAEFRRDHTGFVFQSFYLVPTLTAIENVALSGIVANRRRKDWAEDARLLLAELGLADLAERYPRDMSGGQQQRVAVARALFATPDVLLADEPTGNLDQHAANDVMGMLRDAVDSRRARCGVVVTHSDRAAAFADRVVVLVDGEVRGQYCLPARQPDTDEEVARVELLRAWLATTGL